MTTIDCLRKFSECDRCGDLAVENFDHHSICYSCNNVLSDDTYEIPDWALKEYIGTSTKNALTTDEEDF
jgi:hypothetical protein